MAVEVDSYTGECLMISELMVNGDIVEFIRSNSVNRLRLVTSLLFSSATTQLILPPPSLRMPLKAWSSSTVTGFFTGASKG